MDMLKLIFSTLDDIKKKLLDVDKRTSKFEIQMTNHLAHHTKHEKRLLVILGAIVAGVAGQLAYYIFKLI